jgi:hypothetical protein
MGPTGGLLPVKPLSSGGELASRPSHRADSGASLWEPSAASASIMAAWRLWGGVPARVGPQGHGAWGSTHVLGTSARVGLTQSNTSTIPCVSLRTRMGQRAAHRKQTPPIPTAYVDLIPCLRCNTPFESWDRRQNRLCDACRQAIEEQPSEEPPYLIPEPRHLPPRAR